MAMGLDGYRFPVPKVERFPEYLPDAFVVAGRAEH
jgi:hypothetical protein